MRISGTTAEIASAHGRKLRVALAAGCACVAIAAGIAAGPVQSAYATPGTDDYPEDLKDAGVDGTVDSWRFYSCECVSFVAWRLNNDNKVEFDASYLDEWWGDAASWADAAENVGITVDQTPAIGSVAWTSEGACGHVAWVLAIDGDQVTVEEYNYHPAGVYNVRTVSSDEFEGYIHIADLQQSATVNINEASVTQFVRSLYITALGRGEAAVNVDAQTINAQVNAMVSGESATQMACNVFGSQEFANRKLGNSRIVRIAYQCLLDREPSAKDLVAWTQKLKQGLSPVDLVKSLCQSDEFEALCQKNGLVSGGR